MFKAIEKWIGKNENAWLNTEIRYLGQEVLQLKSWKLKGILEKFCFVIILFLMLLLDGPC